MPTTFKNIINTLNVVWLCLGITRSKQEHVVHDFLFIIPTYILMHFSDVPLDGVSADEGVPAGDCLVAH